MLSWPLCGSEGRGRPARRGSGLRTVLRGFVQSDGAVWSPGGPSEASRILKAAFMSLPYAVVGGEHPWDAGLVECSSGAVGRSWALQRET